MRKLFSLALVGAIVWWLRGKRRGASVATATIGYADGSSVTLEEGAPELDRLVQAARSVTRREVS